MSNKTYDILKYIALIVLPALATLVIAIFTIWGIPYGEAIAGTITAIDVFLGTLLGVSSKQFKEYSNQMEWYEAKLTSYEEKIERLENELEAMKEEAL